MSVQIKNSILLAVLFFICMIILGCGQNLYKEEAIKTLISPDRQWVAVVYKSGAGATGASATSVNIFSSLDKVASASTEPIRKGCVFIVKDYFDVDLFWKSAADLEIELHAPENAEIIKFSNKYEDINILLKHAQPTSQGVSQTENFEN